MKLKKSNFMKKLVLLSAIVFGLVFSSCSSDDDNNSKEEISLVGDWQLTNVDFTVMSDDGGKIRATDNCIMEIIAGYQFRQDNSFFFILGEAGSSFPTKGDYWTWEGDADDFKIIQANGAMPPYNFSVKPTDLKVETIDGKNKMTFNSEMANGSVAKFILVKEKIDQAKLPQMTAPDGLDYEYCNYFDK